jgi:HEAT repeat protein
MKKTTILIFLLIPTLLLAKDKLSTQQLLDDLKSPDAGKRAKAAEELGDRGEALGLTALIQATTDKDERVQMAAVTAIGKMNHPQKVSALSQAVRNTKGKAQKEAMHLLTEHYIPSRDQNAFQELWNSLGDLFNPPHPVVAEPWIKVDAEAIDALLSVLDDKNSENRVDAAATLGILRVERAIPQLSYYLQSPHKPMVRTCIRSLGYIGKSESGQALIPLLKHSDKDIVMDSARVLGQFRYRQALPELQQFMDYSRDQDLKRVALQAISRIGDRSSEPTIKKYLSSDDKELRQYAIEGLGRMKLPQYTEFLEREFQREDNRQIKLALCYSLFAIGDTAYIDTLIRSIDDRLYKNQVREYFMELGEPALPKMAEYLRVSDEGFKVQVIRIMGEMHQPKAIQYLEPYMKDKNLEIAQAATDAIRELRKVQGLSEA